ncbi:IS3 family transposase [Halostreptopolyspora alba]|uniref:Integrase catalytic domain-containing protein n=1 Tax=Halostreptopolyspora alba TaxID=2487137 RepID=A0A3N0EDR4_9ACTN|nr:hypothetical protein EFW17_05505 [Nocardiopsaceae bacterium YIM 96095]
MVESWFSTLKQEPRHQQPWPSRHQAELGVFDHIEVLYNRHRPHSALGLRSPLEYEHQEAPIPSNAT